MDINYKIIRSNRTTVGLQVTPEGLIVRAPYRYPREKIDALVLEKKDWIEKSLKKVEKREAEKSKIEKFSQEEIRALAEQALQVIPKRVAYYAEKLGVSYGRITIRNQKSRWGSCSSKGNLNFNCLLMLTPPEVLDSVVVHELCHRKEMNHSERFYQEVLRVYPDYWKYHKWLKENGDKLIMRLP
jgi:predicted metal-dependent hydrolase